MENNTIKNKVKEICEDNGWNQADVALFIKALILFNGKSVEQIRDMTRAINKFVISNSNITISSGL